jgi:hypothetical protein
VFSYPHTSPKAAFGFVIFLSRRKNALIDKFLPIGNTMVQVDPQCHDGGSAGRRPSHQARTIPTEMPLPLVATWMKQWDDLFCLRIDAAQVRPFEAVAEGTNVRRMKLSDIDPRPRFL